MSRSKAPTYRRKTSLTDKQVTAIDPLDDDDGIAHLAQDLASKAWLSPGFPFNLPMFSVNIAKAPWRRIQDVVESYDGMRISFDRRPRPCFILTTTKTSLQHDAVSAFEESLRMVMDLVIGRDNFSAVEAIELAFGAGAMRSSNVHFKCLVEPGLYISRLEVFAKAQEIVHGVGDDVRAAIIKNARRAASNLAWHKVDLDALRQNGELKPLNEVDTPSAKKVVKEMAAHGLNCALSTAASMLVLTVGDKINAPHVTDVARVLRSVETVCKALTASGIVNGWLSLPRPDADPALRWMNVIVSIYEDLHSELLGQAPLQFTSNEIARTVNITVKNDLVCLVTAKLSSFRPKTGSRIHDSNDQRVAPLPAASPPNGQVIECQICRTGFFFSDGELAVFKQRGFASPKRCKPCRIKQTAVRKTTVPSAQR